VVSLNVQVYSDGSAFITQSNSVSQGTTSFQATLLSPVIADVVAVDQNGAPLSFRISGSNITVYSLGSTGVTLKYDTQNLTTKVGAVWTVRFNSGVNVTLTLPASSTVTYASGTPSSIQVESGEPVLGLPPGAWVVSYGLPVGPGAGTTSTSTSPGGGSQGLDLRWVAAAAIVLGAVAIGALLLWGRGSGPEKDAEGLREDDAKVVAFIEERGGRVLEPEIRTKFALPKTSAWRQIKRLERMGYVRVTKVGSQNQIELLKKGEQGS
jgi:uncharacterized membrane protein